MFSSAEERCFAIATIGTRWPLLVSRGREFRRAIIASICLAILAMLFITVTAIPIKQSTSAVFGNGAISVVHTTEENHYINVSIADRVSIVPKWYFAGSSGPLNLSYIIVPLWPIALVIGVLATVFWTRHHVLKYEICRFCGYRLHDANTCPECGRLAHSTSSHLAGRRTRR